MPAGSRNELHSTKVAWRDVAEAELLAGMRNGYYGAYFECYCRFAPMLHRMARRRGVPEDDREALVSDHLEDTLIPILRGARSDPSPLGAYLAAGFRRRLVSTWRSRQREASRRRSLETTSSGSMTYDRLVGGIGRERVVAEGLSEYALRSARPPDAGIDATAGPDNPASGELIATTREARSALANALARLMTPEEREIMGQVAEHYPQREIAAAFGVGPSGMRMRVLRLRERLTREAAHYISALPAEEGILLARFLGTPRAHHTPAERLPARQHAGHRQTGDECI